MLWVIQDEGTSMGSDHPSEMKHVDPSHNIDKDEVRRCNKCTFISNFTNFCMNRL